MVARTSTPNAPNAAASDGVTNPFIIRMIIVTITPTIGTTSVKKRVNFVINVIGSTS
jgi:hypothetical protein